VDEEEKKEPIEHQIDSGVKENLGELHKIEFTK
jgi:hypothetical protein